MELELDDIVTQLTCPISGAIFSDPVVAADGFTYEKSQITRWFMESMRSPANGTRISHSNVYPNNLAKHLVNQLLKQRPELAEKQFVPEFPGSIDGLFRFLQTISSMDQFRRMCKDIDLNELTWGDDNRTLPMLVLQSRIPDAKKDELLNIILNEMEYDVDTVTEYGKALIHYTMENGDQRFVLTKDLFIRMGGFDNPVNRRLLDTCAPWIDRSKQTARYLIDQLGEVTPNHVSQRCVPALEKAFRDTPEIILKLRTMVTEQSSWKLLIEREDDEAIAIGVKSGRFFPFLSWEYVASAHSRGIDLLADGWLDECSPRTLMAFLVSLLQYHPIDHPKIKERMDQMMMISPRLFGIGYMTLMDHPDHYHLFEVLDEFLSQKGHWLTVMIDDNLATVRHHKQNWVTATKTFPNVFALPANTQLREVVKILMSEVSQEQVEDTLMDLLEQYDSTTPRMSQIPIRITASVASGILCQIIETDCRLIRPIKWVLDHKANPQVERLEGSLIEFLLDRGEEGEPAVALMLSAIEERRKEQMRREEEARKWREEEARKRQVGEERKATLERMREQMVRRLQESKLLEQNEKEGHNKKSPAGDPNPDGEMDLTLELLDDDNDNDTPSAPEKNDWKHNGISMFLEFLHGMKRKHYGMRRMPTRGELPRTSRGRNWLGLNSTIWPEFGPGNIIPTFSPIMKDLAEVDDLDDLPSLSDTDEDDEDDDEEKAARLALDELAMEEVD